MTIKTLEQLLKENIISQRTYDKVVLSKQYIERKYNFKSKNNLELKNFFSELNRYKINESKLSNIKRELLEKQNINHRKLREKQSIREYESLSIIGRGAFGEVHVCRKIKTGEIVAIKKMKKDVLIEKNQIIHIRNEQQFMSKVKSPWIVDLKASFQEDDYLYLVMEFCPGGDLMNLLMGKDILPEKEAKFYMAELVLAIESIHKLDCIHRDIKPDNILIDADGHIKLTDFGLSKISEKIFEQKNVIDGDKSIYTHNKNYSCVGTALYVAPEVLNKTGYSKDIDWWSAGIIFYEMLVGYSPFCSKDTSQACYKVINWEKYFKIPQKIKMRISEEAQDLIYKLINDSNKRLGKNGSEEIKQHPFFGDIDWNNLHKMKPPFIPFLVNEYDTKYFHTFKELEPFYPQKIKINKKRKDIEYLGYTYKEENDNYNQIDIFENIKKSLVENDKNKNEKNNNTLITDCTTNINKNKNSNSKRDSFETIKNEFLLKYKNSNNTSRNKNGLNNKNNNNNNNKSNNSCYKGLKLNIIQLPRKKSKNNVQKVNLKGLKKNNLSLKNINNNKTISIQASKISKKKMNLMPMKFNNKPKKNIKGLSPKNNRNIIFKLLNLSKDKNKPMVKSSNNSRQKSKKFLNNNISNFNHNKQKELKKNKENNVIKIINIIQNKNYNNIDPHNTKNQNNGRNVNLTKNDKISYNLTYEN